MLKAELHVHTRYSKDCALPLWLIYAICRMKRVSVIAITDHNTVQGAKAFSSFCKKHGGRVLVIIGEEIMTQDGEIIGLYLKDSIPKGLSAEETVNRIVQQGGIVYVPHPYDEKRHKTVLKESALRQIFHKVDCIECHNGRNISTHFSDEQKAIAEKYRLVQVVGSDAHTCFELGRNYLLLEAEDLSEPELFKKALASARMHPKQCLRFAHWITKGVRILKMIQAGQVDMIIRKVAGKRN